MHICHWEQNSDINLTSSVFLYTHAHSTIITLKVTSTLTYNKQPQWGGVFLKYSFLPHIVCLNGQMHNNPSNHSASSHAVDLLCEYRADIWNLDTNHHNTMIPSTIWKYFTAAGRRVFNYSQSISSRRGMQNISSGEQQATCSEWHECRRNINYRPQQIRMKCVKKM